MDQNIERRQFVCPKCGCNSYEHDQFQATGGNFAKIFDVQNKSLLRSAAHAADLPSYIRARLQRA